MKKITLMILIIVLTGCSYKPVVDSRGLNGKEVAHRYNDDLETCRSIAKENTNDFVIKRFTTITLDQLQCGYLIKWSLSTNL